MSAGDDANAGRSSEAMLNNGGGSSTRRGGGGSTAARPRADNVAPRGVGAAIPTILDGAPRRVLPRAKLSVLSASSVQGSRPVPVGVARPLAVVAQPPRFLRS